MFVYSSTAQWSRAGLHTGLRLLQPSLWSGPRHRRTLGHTQPADKLECLSYVPHPPQGGCVDILGIDIFISICLHILVMAWDKLCLNSSNLVLFIDIQDQLGIPV